MAEKVTFVSLGDSIATGTLTPFSKTHSYVFYLQKRFMESGYQSDTFYLAHDGDTSADLLQKLNHSHHFCNTVKKADFITISIGGNDLLKASSIPGFASINVHTAEHWTRAFLHNWPQIIDKIRSINPLAKIVALNLYNPYNHSQHDRKLYEITDRFLTRFNDAIAAYSKNNYYIADVYSAFKPFSEGKMRQVSCLYPESMLRNPHPTPKAQKMIADLIFEQFK